MRRHCNGQDPNLVRQVGIGPDGESIWQPCDCGLIFDDIDRLVIYPHQRTMGVGLAGILTGGP